MYISLYTCMHMTNGKSLLQRTYDTQFATTRLQIWSSSLLKYEQLYNRCSLHSTILLQHKDTTNKLIGQYSLSRITK